MLTDGTRRVAVLAAFVLISGLAAAMFGPGGPPSLHAQGKVLHVGVILPFTGTDAEQTTLTKNSIVMAIEEQNAKGGISGYKIEGIMLDSSTTTAGGFDPAQAAVNARKAAQDPLMVGLLGPFTSSEGKAMSPILSEADLATITGSASNPDITEPKYASTYRPKGRTVFFRTVPTDKFIASAVANFFAEKLHVKSVFVLDDGGAFGIGGADIFQKRAVEKGMKVLGRDQVNPKEADYTVILGKIKALHPDALFLGANVAATIRVAKQGYDVMPGLIKNAEDSSYSGSFLKAVGFPAAADNWYAVIGGPRFQGAPAVQPFAARYSKRWAKNPDDQSIMYYSAALALFDAIGRVAKSGKPVDRHAVRNALVTTRLRTPQGEVSFDSNGDMTHPIVSVYKCVHNSKYPDDDVAHQFQYLGPAPEK